MCSNGVCVKAASAEHVVLYVQSINSSILCEVFWGSSTRLAHPPGGAQQTRRINGRQVLNQLCGHVPQQRCQHQRQGGGGWLYAACCGFGVPGGGAK